MTCYKTLNVYLLLLLTLIFTQRVGACLIIYVVFQQIYNFSR